MKVLRQAMYLSANDIIDIGDGKQMIVKIISFGFNVTIEADGLGENSHIRRQSFTCKHLDFVTVIAR